MNFFQRPKELKKIKREPYEKTDMVEYDVRDTLVKASIDEKGNVDKDNFITQKEAYEVSRVDFQDYVESFRDDVGIENILKKVALSGDVSLYDQVKRTPLPTDENGKEMIQDVTALQNGEESIGQIGDNMRKTYSEMPEELKAGRSLEKFLEGVSQAEIDAFVKAQVEKKLGGSEDGSK